MKYLLDTSVLFAWIWEQHRFHHSVVAWGKGKTLGICPMSEVAFLRISSSTRFGATLADARQALRLWLAKHQPETVPADLRALDGRPAPSSAKVFDWYLADLAEQHGMRWATLDKGAKEHPAAELAY